jgi:uncharacterized protein YjbJ (UPF0337 family)
MGELTDKIKGNVNEAIGKAKQAIADHDRPETDADAQRNADLKADGAGQELKGKGQQLGGKIKGALGDDI